jgi:DNA topoisomerase VI subunit A
MGLHPFDVLSYPPLSACKKDLTEADVSLANKLLASEVVKHRPGLARLLKAMLKANAKLELESTVLADPEFLVETYLPNKLQEFGVFVQ